MGHHRQRCATDSGADYLSYSGSGWCVGGSASENGSQADSYGFSANYGLDASGNWDPTGGSGGYSASGGDYLSYSGSGTWWRRSAARRARSAARPAKTAIAMRATRRAWAAPWAPAAIGKTPLPAAAPGDTTARYLSYSGSGSYSRGDWSTYAASGSLQASGYQDLSDSYQTALGLDSSGNVIDTSGSGSTCESSGGGFSYYGGGSFSEGYSGGGYPWLQSTTSEHGSQSNSQGQTENWDISAGQWSASGPAQAGPAAAASRITAIPPAAARRASPVTTSNCNRTPIRSRAAATAALAAARVGPAPAAAARPAITSTTPQGTRPCRPPTPGRSRPIRPLTR